MKKTVDTTQDRKMHHPTCAIHRLWSRINLAALSLALASIMALGCGGIEGELGPEDENPSEEIESTSKDIFFDSSVDRGWVRLDNPSPTLMTAHTPPLAYQYNTSGLTNTVMRTGTGTYRVRFPNVLTFSWGTTVGQRGNVQITSRGLYGEWCNVSSWRNYIYTVEVNVNCFDKTGMPANTKFEILYLNNRHWSQLCAYLTTSDPTASVETPSLNLSLVSRRIPATVTRTATGCYSVVLREMKSLGSFSFATPYFESGTTQVTAFGTGSEYCKVSTWYHLGDYRTVVVKCFDKSGAPADSRFSMAHASGELLAWPHMAYLWMHDANSAIGTWVATASKYQYNTRFPTFSTATAITSRRTATGKYDVLIPGQSASDKTAALVTARGTGSERCNIINWFAVTGGTLAQVTCFNSMGGLTNAQFTMSYMTDDLI